VARLYHRLDYRLTVRAPRICLSNLRIRRPVRSYRMDYPVHLPYPRPRLHDSIVSSWPRNYNLPSILFYVESSLRGLESSIYVCIGRLADYLGRGTFNIRPRLYARIFIPSDIFALVIQSSGGGISINEKIPLNGGVTTGQAIIIGGLTLQVVSLAIFFVLFVGVIWPADLFRSRRLRKLAGRDGRLKIFAVLISVAILLIIGRSIYRTVEFSQGIFGSLSHNEVLFIILDGFPMAIATSILVLYHPVYCIPSTSTSPDAGSQELRFLSEDARYRPVST